LPQGGASESTEAIGADNRPGERHLPPVAAVGARWLFDSLAASPIIRDIKIGKAMHLMHLETMRFALYRESIAFLNGGDAAPAP
jgi:hypothetical protein